MRCYIDDPCKALQIPGTVLSLSLLVQRKNYHLRNMVVNGCTIAENGVQRLSLVVCNRIEIHVQTLVWPGFHMIAAIVADCWQTSGNQPLQSHVNFKI